MPLQAIDKNQNHIEKGVVEGDGSKSLMSPMEVF